MTRKATIILMTVSAAFLSMPFVSVADEDHHLLLNKHPKLRKIFKAGGIGMMTGGMAAPLIGHSVAGGAVLGAGKGAAVQTYKDKKAEKKRQQQHNHI